MDSSRLISLIYRDKPGIVYENPPPPNDDFEYDFSSENTFIYPMPQSVKGVDFIKIDRSLIHKSLLGYEDNEEEEQSSEAVRGNETNEAKTAIRTEELSAEIPVIKNTLDKEIGEIESSEEDLISNSALGKTKIKCEILDKDESTRFPKKKKKKKKHRSKEDRKNYIDSDDSKNYKKKKDRVSESSALQSIIKSYSTSDSDSDYDEKYKTKTFSHHSKSHSKKSSRHKKRDKESKHDTSNDVISYDKLGLRSSEFSVKQEVISSDEEDINTTFSKKAEITVKEEAVSDEDIDRKSEKKRSKSSKKRYDEFRNYKSRNLEDSRSHYDARKSDYSSDEDSRNRCYDDSPKNRSYDDSPRRKSFDDSPRNKPYDDSPRNRSYDDGSRIRSDDDSNNCYRNLKTNIKMELKQEIKQEPGSASYYGPNDFYCDVCKLLLNSETTFSSHMAGKRHKKALRQLSEQEVAKSSIYEIMESQIYPRPPGVDRIELRDEVSKIQETCEDADLLILGLDFVQEIQGYDETKYFCNLCDAQCVANSIIKHLIGFKHQMNCLKEYCFSKYHWVKDLDKRRADMELKVELEKARKRYGKGRIKVFKDIRRNQRSPEPYNPYQPSTSKQVLLPGNVQGKKADEQKITDEDCLSRDFSDFYCKVCDSHMNNYAMWESHARGKKHAKNKKKAPEGLVTNNNFIEQPPGTISHLEEMLEEQCAFDDIIVGLSFIRENQGENGDLYNCYLCGSVCTTIDIVDHLYLKKHKTKYLEKMLSDGYQNAIKEISSLPISENSRESLIDDECTKLVKELGRGRPVIAIPKKIF